MLTCPALSLGRKALSLNAIGAQTQYVQYKSSPQLAIACQLQPKTNDEILIEEVRGQGYRSKLISSPD